MARTAAVRTVVSAPAADRGLALAQVLALCTLGWGALAFGAVYPWAYWPLALASVISAATALAVTRTLRVAAVDRAFVLSLAGVGATIVAQIVPLPIAVVTSLSPRSIELLTQLNPAVAAGLVEWHPLSVWPRDTSTALALFGAFALLLVGLAQLLSAAGARRFVEALTAFAVILALIGIVQKPLYTGSIYGLWELELGRLPFGPFVNRNHFAGWMVMALPLALALLAAGIDRGMRGLKPGWRYKVLWFSSPEASQLILAAAAALVMALSLVFTMSRSGMAAFFLSLLMTGWFIGRTFESRWRRLAAAAALMSLVAIVVVWAGPDVIVRRFASGDWGEFNNRRGAWTDAWSVARSFPLAGTGLNTYWAAALFYQRHDLDFFFAQAHNDYLQLAAEGGILLVLPLAVCVLLFVRVVWRRMREDRGSPEWWLRAGAVTSLVAIGCQETVEFSLQMPGNAALFAVVCAIALHRPLPADTAGAGEPRPRQLRLVSSWGPDAHSAHG